MRSIRKFRHRKRAFTLIELIMTTIVVGIIAIPLSLLISQHLESVFQSQDYSAARNLARLEMEKVSNTDYAGISSVSFSNYEGYDYDLARTVSYEQGGAADTENLKKISLTVTKHGKAEVLVRLVTYIAKNVSYGL